MNEPQIWKAAFCAGGLALLWGCQTVERVAATKPPAEAAPVKPAPVPDATAEVSPEIELPLEDALFSELNTGKLELIQFTSAGSRGRGRSSRPSPAAPDAGPAPIDIEQKDDLTPPSPDEVPKLKLSLPPLEPVAPGTAGGMTLEDFEAIALRNNPAIMTASASASKAAGFREQVGLYPNPSGGYLGQQLADRHTDQQLAYVEQEFVTAHKLQKNQQIHTQQLQSQLWQVEAQRLRVLTDVRTHYYQALAAQVRRDLAKEFQAVADEGVRIAEIRRKALEGSVPEVLQAEIQLNEVDLIRQRAEIAYQAAWRELTSVAGVPGMEPHPLLGSLRVDSTPQDWDLVYAQMLASSPALHAAQAIVARARANVDRQQVQPVPNVLTVWNVGRDMATDSGMYQVQAGVPLPIFNQNQGNISAAHAEYCRATQDVRRIELSIRQGLAQASQNYDSARITVERYENQILPKAKQTLELSEKAYTAGEFGFLQVLVARRTYFDSNLQYNTALMELAQAKWLIDGMLLEGGLNETPDTTLDDGLRGQTLSGQ
jgi:cobalt-zinc-cadmium efflux system outer membrane protein